jgi:hypothetical protein
LTAWNAVRAASIVLHDVSHIDPAGNRAQSVAAVEVLIQRYEYTS